MSHPNAVEPDVRISKYPKHGRRHAGDAKQYHVSVPTGRGTIHGLTEVLSLNPAEAEAAVLGLLCEFPVAAAGRVTAEYLARLPDMLETTPLDGDELIQAAIHAVNVAARLVPPGSSRRLREAVASTLGMPPLPAPSGRTR
ncbi:hypothetical protein ACIBSV_29985 [Embleya sp. NPDC050154]|uniref:hypothetical protein n=1 Tax=Embleya sp. NPDC050154 TaxID=3363988 RepID=UPI00379761CB